METPLYWELSVLAQSIQYNNLSGASSHVGLSQPQLSRIVAKIESHLNVVLLDRGARRKSAWTPMAYNLAEAFQKNIHHLNSDISRLVEGIEPTSLKIGTLEGLIGLASEFSDHLFKLPTVRNIELDVFDIGQLEGLFTKGQLDFIFTFREPGRKKYQFLKKLGYQTMELLGEGHHVGVVSPFELAEKNRRKNTPEFEKVLVSNSLIVRKNWIEAHDGTGFIPSEVRNDRKLKDGDPLVLLIGADHMGAGFWKKSADFRE
jgi:LysR family transcriptional regulator, transcriptional activator for aaeXAB operon